MPVCRILVVDDNLVNRRVLDIWLRRQGFEVHSVVNGQAALDFLQGPGGDVDFVFMDCHMPVLDGCEATRRYRRWEQATQRPKRLPIVALTAGGQSSEQACLESGMDAYLVKPLDFQKIADVLGRLIRP